MLTRVRAPGSRLYSKDALRRDAGRSSSSVGVRGEWHIEVASDVFYDAETVADLAAAVSALRASA